MVFVSIFADDYLSLVTAEIRPYLENMTKETSKYASNNFKINEYKDQFSSALDDYKKAYVPYNTAPENEEYAVPYNTAVSNLEQITSNLSKLQIKIQDDIKKHNELTTKINDEIIKEKERNQSLLEELSKIESAHSGSSIMISNFKKLYSSNYYTNIGMFVGILGSFYIFYTFSKYPSIFSSNNMSIPKIKTSQT